MVFSSHAFLFFFLPIFLAGYYLLHITRVGISWQNLFITVASYFFYGWFEPWFVILMWVSTIVDYVCGRCISKQNASPLQRNTALMVSIIVNLGMLFYFKYWMFFTGGLNTLMEFLGMGPDYFPLMAITLPIGISFYTFQTMSYTIDVWRGDAPPVKDLRTFSCFVALFPQLIAGPIIRYNTVAGQLEERHHTLNRFLSGVFLFSLGMAKKILIANPCGQIADGVFGADSPGALLAWWGALGYSLQIYFDFSGYSDMAVGLGRMIGFEFVKNFDAPYRAQSISDFWRRWHMSLTKWFTDYLYIPLGGNRVNSKSRLYFNLFLVMFLSGVWHGANATFVAWGLFHAFFLISERAMNRESVYRNFPFPIRILFTQIIVIFAWVLFRAPSLEQAGLYWLSMLGLRSANLSAELLPTLVATPYLIFTVLLAIIICLQPRQGYDSSLAITPLRLLVSLLLLALSIAVMFSQTFNPFLYFQF